MIEPFVVAILFLFLNLLFCFKKVPLVAIIIGLYTWYITAMVFIGSSSIPVQPYFSFFLLLVSTTSMLINVLDIRK